MNLRNLVLAFFLGALLAGGITWLVMRPAPADTDPGGAARLSAQRGTAGSHAAAASPEAEPADPTLTGAPTATEHYHALQSENRDLEAKVEELEARIVELQPPPKDPRAFRFGLPAKAPSFDQAGWTELSDHMTKLAELLSTLKDSLVAGGDPGPKEIAEIVKHNTPLATFAVSFGADLDDPNPNGAYTHPAVVANLMRAALAEAGMPLSEDQEISIQALGNAWIGDQERAMSSLPADTPTLSRTVLEVDAKLRFLESAKRVLTEAQRDVLFHPETEGRLKLDLLSPALAYVLSFPVEAESAEAMQAKLVERLFAQAGIEMDDLSSFEWVGREWVDAIPGVTEPINERSVDLMFPHVDVVQNRARAQAAAMERILAMRTLPDEQAAQLREVSTLLYPYILQ